MTDADFHQPPGWADRALYRDDDAPHQIRLNCLNGVLVIGCTCGSYYREMHGADEIGRAVAIYRADHGAKAVELRTPA